MKEMSNMFNKYLLILSLSFMTTPADTSPKIYSATYSLEKNGIEFGHSKHSIKYNAISDEWCLHTKSYTVGIFSIKKDDRNETSCFYYNKEKHLMFLNKDLATNDFLKTNTYSFTRIKSNSNQIIESKRINNILITSENDKTIPHSPKVNIDRLLAQLFGYSFKNILVNDKGREREYRFTILGKDTIESPLGLTETLIVKKSITNSKRSTLTWYSIENNYLPIMIKQYRLDQLKVTAKLIDLKR